MQQCSCNLIVGACALARVPKPDFNLLSIVKSDVICGATCCCVDYVARDDLTNCANYIPLQISLCHADADHFPQ